MEQGAKQVEGLVIELETLGEDSMAIAEEVGKTKYSKAEKVIGTYYHMTNILKAPKHCDNVHGAGNLYGFLERLVGASEISHSGGIRQLISNTEERVICRSYGAGRPSSKLFSIAVRISDDLWWCGSNFGYNAWHTAEERGFHGGLWNGFYKTAPQGNIHKGCHNAKRPRSDSKLFDGRPVRDYNSDKGYLR